MSFREAHLVVSFSPDLDPTGRCCYSNQVFTLEQRSRQTVLPPISNRTLQHPSFQPLYTNRNFHHLGYPVSPAELFYTDPTLPCGRRIYNGLSRKMVIEGSQFSTPLPIMSACIAPPNRPDPFRAGSYPPNTLGSPSWRIQDIPAPHAQSSFFVIQLTEQEDQVITNLLKLHHQEAAQGRETIPAAHVHLNEASLEETNEAVCINMLEEGGRWSNAEYEAAGTLLSSFHQVDDYVMGKMETHPDQSVSKTELEWQIFPQLETCNNSQNGSGPDRNGDVGCENNMDACPPVFESKSEAETSFRSKMETLSDLEGDAVQVLLSLGEVMTFNVMQ